MILINTAIEFNNAAVRLQKEKKHAMALAKLRNAVNSLEAKEDDRETPQSPLHNDQMLQYKYDEGIRAFTFFLTTISPDDRHDKDYVEAVIAYNLGICCSLQNQFALASDYFADTHCYLCSRKFSHNDSNKKLQSSLVHLNEGHNYFRAGNYEEALDSYWDAVNQANQDGNNDLQIGAALNCIGATSFTSLLQENDLGQLTRRALAPLNGALSTFMDTCGEDGGPDTRRTYSFMATIVNNIGRVRYCVEDHEGALPFFEKAYSVRRSHYGDDHLDVGMSALNVGFCLHKLGEAQEAINFYRRYVEIMLTDDFQQYLGDFVGLVMLIGDMWLKDNDHSTAIVFFKIGLESAIRHHGEVHSKVSDILSKIGNASYEDGDWEYALQVHEQGLAVERQLLAPEINLAVTLSSIAVIYDDRGMYHLALSTYKEALEIFQSNEGCELHAAKTLSAIALIKAQSVESLQDASTALQQALRLREKVSDVYDIDTSCTLNLLGVLYAKQNRFQQSLLCLEKCLKMRRALNMPHTEIAVLLYDICDLLVDKFDNSERALRYYQESLELECSGENCDLAEFLETLERIGNIYELHSEPHQAIAFYVQAAFKCEEIDAIGVLGDKWQRKNLSRYLFQVGNSCLEVGDVKKAVKSFARAMRFDAEECKEQFRVPFSQELYKCWVTTCRGAAGA
jgi:tetratricopeptide (TPR) repeat protein